MVVFQPACRRQTGRSQKDPGQTPKIDRAVAGMATRTFRTKHRNGACDRAGEPQHDMNPTTVRNTGWVEGMTIPAKFVVPSSMPFPALRAVTACRNAPHAGASVGLLRRGLCVFDPIAPTGRKVSSALRMI